MEIFKKAGSKDRLFEMMGRVNNINEEFLKEKERENLINIFIQYVLDFLKITDEKPNIVMSHDKKEAANMKSFGKYVPANDEIRVVVSNRNLADILRTLAHEMVHFKQRIENKITYDSNKDGSEVENEANALAAVIMREFGKKYTKIFE